MRKAKTLSTPRCDTRMAPTKYELGMRESGVDYGHVPESSVSYKEYHTEKAK